MITIWFRCQITSYHKKKKAIGDTKSHALLLEQTPLVCDFRSECQDVYVDIIVPSMFESLCDVSPFRRDPMFPGETKGFVNHIASDISLCGS